MSGWPDVRRRMQEQNEKEFKLSSEASFITGRMIALNPKLDWNTTHAQIMKMLKDEK